MDITDGFDTMPVALSDTLNAPITLSTMFWYLSEIAGYPISTQPIPSEFIDMLATDAMRFTSQGQIPT